MVIRNFNKPGKIQEPFRNKEGFALIITISLLTFLILVLFAMTTLTRVETRMAGSTQQVNVARENARMALNVAIGQLQRHAGSDYSVTARADIDPGNEFNPYWTGVWEDGNGPLTVWLVSGNEINSTMFKPDVNVERERGDDRDDDPWLSAFPSLPSGANVGAVMLVNSNSSGTDDDPLYADKSLSPVPGGVLVPKIPVLSRNYSGLPQSSGPGQNHVVGHYAYWVGDQGVKTSVGLPERHLDVVAYSGNDEERRRLRQMISQRFWFDGGSGSSPILSSYPQFNLGLTGNDRLKNALSVDQARSATSFSDADLKDRYHDVAHMSYGVLTGINKNGTARLKEDLTTTTDTFGGAFSNYINSASRSAYALKAPDSAPADGEPLFFVSPVISEFVVRYSVWQPEGGALRIRVDADVELWNPYTVDLDLENSALFVRLSDDNREPLQVEVTHSYSATPQVLDLRRSGADIIEIQHSGNSTLLLAGAVAHRSYTAEFSANDIDGNPIVFEPDPANPVPEPGISIADEARSLEVELWLLEGVAHASPRSWTPEDGPEASGDLVGKMIMDFLPLDTESIDAESEEPRFGYSFRLQDGGDNPDWLTLYDPRQIGLTEEYSGALAIYIENKDPAAAWDYQDWDSDAAHLLVESEEDNDDNKAIRLKLFELPLQETVSLGALQHVYVHNRLPYTFGNLLQDSSDDFHELFDTHFTSGVTGGWNFPLPNTRLLEYDAPSAADLNSDPAGHMLIQGAFNINSTSVHAWRSVLGSLSVSGNSFDPSSLNGWVYEDGTFNLESAVFRFSQTAHLSRMNLTPQRDPEDVLSSNYRPYYQGVRELTPEQIYALAFEIVEQIQDFYGAVGKVHFTDEGRPFYSIKEFVDMGIIQTAIDRLDGVDSSGNIHNLSLKNPVLEVYSSISRDDLRINTGIPKSSPAFVTQADILTLLAPFILARSDTFVVRAYGDAYNPATDEIEAKAYCEAIVQRVPAPFNPSDSIDAPTGTFGRKFEMIYFRWLTPDEI